MPLEVAGTTESFKAGKAVGEASFLGKHSEIASNPNRVPRPLSGNGRRPVFFTCGDKEVIFSFFKLIYTIYADYYYKKVTSKKKKQSEQKFQIWTVQNLFEVSGGHTRVPWGIFPRMELNRAFIFFLCVVQLVQLLWVNVKLERPVAATIPNERLGRREQSSFKEVNPAHHTDQPPGDSGTASHSSSFTLITQVYNRINSLQEWVSHFDRLQDLDRIIVIWNNLKIPPLNASSLHSRVPLFIERSSVNSMNNRFAPRELIRTKAICLIDDDLRIPLQEVQNAFKLWKLHPRRLIGFLPRAHYWNEKKELVYSYRPLSDGSYSMILASSAFFHSMYLDLYHSPPMKPYREYVDKVFNCDDILLNFLIANYTNAPPIMVKGEVIDVLTTSEKGLSHESGWINARHKCLNEFVTMFGSNPLKYGYFQAIPYVEQHFLQVIPDQQFEESPRVLANPLFQLRLGPVLIKEADYRCTYLYSFFVR